VLALDAAEALLHLRVEEVVPDQESIFFAFQPPFLGREHACARLCIQLHRQVVLLKHVARKLLRFESDLLGGVEPGELPVRELQSARNRVSGAVFLEEREFSVAAALRKIASHLHCAFRARSLVSPDFFAQLENLTVHTHSLLVASCCQLCFASARLLLKHGGLAGGRRTRIINVFSWLARLLFFDQAEGLLQQTVSLARRYLFLIAGFRLYLYLLLRSSRLIVRIRLRRAFIKRITWSSRQAACSRELLGARASRGSRNRRSNGGAGGRPSLAALLML
jgi:hypothetical protein